MDQLRTYKLVLLLLTFATSLYAGDAKLIPAVNSPNIIRIVDDVIFLVEGKTYRYTVDTPADSGLVATGLLLKDITTQLKLSTGRPFHWQVDDRQGKRKINGYLTTGDLLHIQTAQQQLTYKVKTEKGALSPRLTCRRETMTIGCPEEIILDFEAGQRSPGTKVDFMINQRRTTRQIKRKYLRRSQSDQRIDITYECWNRDHP